LFSFSLAGINGKFRDSAPFRRRKSRHSGIPRLPRYFGTPLWREFLGSGLSTQLA
jgi:hypothetical protein